MKLFLTAILLLSTSVCISQSQMVITKTNGEIDSLYLSDIKDISFVVVNPIPPTDGLIAWYPFSGTAIDETGNGNNGLLSGDPQFANDRFGVQNSSLYFDGVNDLVEVESSTHPTGNATFTYSFWVKTPASYHSKWRPIIYVGENESNKSSGIYDQATQSNELTYSITVNYITFSYSFKTNANEWVHIVLCKAGNNLTTYVDGNKLSDATISSQNISNTRLFIGGSILGEYYLGRIDDVRIYNRTLTSTEVKALYHEGGW